MLRADCAWPATPQSVRAARAFVERQLEEWDADDLAWAATTVVSELATNAVLHARTDFTVELELRGQTLHLQVGDGSSSDPVRRHYDDDAATGRGLALLEALTTGWGITRTESGKVVWCTVEPSEDWGTTLLDGEVADAPTAQVIPITDGGNATGAAGALAIAA